MSRRGYLLSDEPEPGKMARFAVRPFWPFVSLMLGGAWLAWPWFVFNAYAVGSPTRKKELKLAIGAFVASAALALPIVLLLGLELVPRGTGKYLALSVTVLKLGFGYALYTHQQRTFPLFEYYGGQVRNGAGVVAAAFVGRLLMLDLPLFFWLVLG